MLMGGTTAVRYRPATRYLNTQSCIPSIFISFVSFTASFSLS